MIGKIATEQDKVEIILEALYFGLTQITFLCKICNVIICNYKVGRMKAYLKKPVFNIHTKEQDIFIQNAIDMCHLFAKTYRFFVGLTITFYAIFPFIENTLPLPGWFPMDMNKYWFFIYIYQLVCLILNGYNHTSFDCMNASLISMASAQFEILKDNLLNLKRSDDDTLTIDQEDRITRKKIAKCVTHHNHIIKFVSYIDDMYSNVIFVQFLCSIVIICVTGFQVFVSGGIGLACYMTEWNTICPETRKLIFIIMERSKIPIVLTAGKFFNLNLSTLMMILRTSYSYLAVLQQMYKT
ncbi:odorant receptor [Holotrichia oblita]|uniref:Odorant receptor n=1 Tax=Holotrichia oblita TaxID=644536 RepID=A0ACB9SWN2_HOLOL|nr:odorant receptor [Holotrichia oblita]